MNFRNNRLFKVKNKIMVSLLFSTITLSIHAETAPPMSLQMKLGIPNIMVHEKIKDFKVLSQYSTKIGIRAYKFKNINSGDSGGIIEFRLVDNTMRMYDPNLKSTIWLPKENFEDFNVAVKFMNEVQENLHVEDGTESITFHFISGGKLIFKKNSENQSGFVLTNQVPQKVYPTSYIYRALNLSPESELNIELNPTLAKDFLQIVEEAQNWINN